MKLSRRIASLSVATIMAIAMMPQAAFADTEETTEYTEPVQQEQTLLDEGTVENEPAQEEAPVINEEAADFAEDAVVETEPLEEEIVGTDTEQIIVVYKKNAECTKEIKAEGFDVTDDKVSADVQAIAEEHAEEIVEDIPAKVSDVEVIGDSVGNNGAAVEMTVTNYEDLDTTMAAIESNTEVALVQRDLKYDLIDSVETSTWDGSGEMSLMATSTNDTYIGRQYYLDPWDSSFSGSCGANVRKAWDLVKSNGKVSVAVLDTGVMINHADLSSNIDTAHAANTSTTNITNNVTDKHGHGTHVAGMIAATANNGAGVAGASYNAKIIPIRVFDDDGGCYSSSLYRAYTYLDALIESGEVTNLHVINMSLGGYTRGYYDDLLEACIEEMRDKHDVITVCAGGNGDSDGKPITDPSYPCDFDACVSVTSLAKNGTNSEWADYNSYKDISAPGEICLNTYNDGKYTYMSGTSVASPLVAGVMALLWAQNPNISADMAVEAIKNTAHPVNKAANDHGSKTGSAGAIDAYAALKYLGAPTVTAPPPTTTTSPAQPTQPATQTTSPSENTIPSEPSDPSTGNSNPGNDNEEVTPPPAGDEPGAGIEEPGEEPAPEEEADEPIPFDGTIKLSTVNYTYNGSVKTPDVTVLDAEGEPVDEDNYDVSYPSGRKNIGTYTITVTFNEDSGYIGDAKASFYINPKGASIKAPSKAKGAITAKWAKQTSKMPSARIGGYQVQIAKNSSFTTGAKTYTVSGYTKTSKKIKSLARKTTYYVHVRTYIKVGGKYYYSSWSSTKSTKTK